MTATAKRTFPYFARQTANGGSAAVRAEFLPSNSATATDKIMPGDFTGDGKTDIAFWRETTGEWFVLRSEDFSFYSFPFGSTGDIPGRRF